MAGEGKVLIVGLEGLGDATETPLTGDRVMEFHISRKAREELGLDASLFMSTGNVIIPDFGTARSLARRINERMDAALLPEKAVRAGRLNAMALIDEILHDVARLYREGADPEAFQKALGLMKRESGSQEIEALLAAFVEDFPPLAVYNGETDARSWLASTTPQGVSNRLLAIEELLLLRLANENPAFGPYRFLFDDGSRPDGESPAPGSIAARPSYLAAMGALEKCFSLLPKFGPDNEDLVSMLRAPMRAAPYSLPGQLDYMRKRWGLLLSDRLMRLLGALDLIREEEKPRFPGPGPTRSYVYRGMETESERFSPDRDWMPKVVMMAKSTLVWLDQLSKAYGRDIRTLDAIPDEELDSLAFRGFNGLWLIGLWERSQASAEIKRRCGNPEAAASAYSLFDYEIAGELGGWPALERLREKCGCRGIRLAADMVPNHTGIDSAWIRERPELFLRRSDCPYPGYSFTGPDLSGDGRVSVWLEDHYWDRTDAAVVFKRLDRGTGTVDYIYHGNDGTGLPWSDTAQIDFLNPAAREAVKERILHVARNFPIIRFDAAMVLAKKHFRRLWYPEPGSGGDVPSRSERAISREAFDAAMPQEFWREVVDGCAAEAPDTLLLAEAFWMMEGYFVRSLGMHRVYNSAFMNMLKKEENAKYRETIRNTQEFDKDILKRFVNFMNNPDEDTAVAQFGKGDKYFGVCTMMATMPGLPMFGHGQVEGFEEKYGMEYRRAYRDEKPDQELLARHEREIFPLLKRRKLFSGVEEFLLYDLVQDSGGVNENVFAYSNGAGGEHALVLYNNAFERAAGRIRWSCPFAEKAADGTKRILKRSIAEAFGLMAGTAAGRADGRAAGRADGRADGYSGAKAGSESYLIMREERSGLWFIRRSREIAESGLAVLLDGFQSQVFLDIFEVADDDRGLYGELCSSLGGRGVPDISEALEDIALKELYASLAGFVNRELFEGARRALEPGLPKAQRRKGIKSLAESLSGPALEFYQGVHALIREEAAEEGLPGPAAAVAEKGETGAPGIARDRFIASLGELAELAILAEAGKPGSAAAIAMESLKEAGSAELAAAYFVMDGLTGLSGLLDPGEEARRMAERFFLERKLREALCAAGVPVATAHRGLSQAIFCLGKAKTFAKVHEKAMTPEKFAGELFRSFGQDEELRSRLGVNTFEGVEWFNKENFESMLRVGTLCAAMHPPVTAAPPVKAITVKAIPAKAMPVKAIVAPSLAKRLETATAVARLFLEAEAASGYRIDELGRILEEKTAAATKPGKARKAVKKEGEA